MHRFRKKSDAKRPAQLAASEAPPLAPRPIATPPVQKPQLIELLPPESDFRTSLILPDLSRRFSLLRQPDGRPVGLNDVREKLAAQRAHGNVNVISEEEEEYVINYLSNAGHIPGGVVDDRGTEERASFAVSSNYAPSSLDSPASAGPIPHSGLNSPITPMSDRSRMSNTSYHNKRHSNNLFGSARTKDYGQMRTVTKKTSGNRSLRSMAQRQGAELSMSNEPVRITNSHSSRPSLATSAFAGDIAKLAASSQGDRPGFAEDPDQPDTPSTGSQPYFPDDLPPIKPLSPRSPVRNGHLSPSPTKNRLSGQVLFTPAQVRRASLALEEVIRNFEQDVNAEEEILTPRTPNGGFVVNGYNRSSRSPRGAAASPLLQALSTLDESSPDQRSTPTQNMVSSGSVPHLQHSSTRQPVQLSRSQSASVRMGSPANTSGSMRGTSRLPGYVPGMHRPITPKDAESEDTSVTPRGTSPASPGSGSRQPILQNQTWQSFAPSNSAPRLGNPPTRHRISTSTSATMQYASTPSSSAFGTPTPTQGGQMQSTWSASTATPTTPSQQLSQALYQFLVPNNAPIPRETKLSTSTSSVFPASTSSSSSSTSLISPFASEAGVTPSTSENNTIIENDKRMQPFGSIAVTDHSRHSQLQSGRADTPVNQMYTGAPASSQRQDLLSPSRAPADHGKMRTQPSWSDSMWKLSPALPDSPFVDGGSSSMRSHNGPVLAVGGSDSRRDSEVSQDPTDSMGFRRGSRTQGMGSFDGSRSGYQQAFNENQAIRQLPAQSPRHSHQRSLSNSAGDILSNPSERSATPKELREFGVKSNVKTLGVGRATPPKPILIHNPSSSTASSIVMKASNSVTRSPNMSPLHNSLSLQPIFNSSRSSLLSTGSSFHGSDDAGSTLDFEKPVRATPQTSEDPDDEDATESDYEDLLGCWGGFSKSDISSIHAKLVKNASTKRAQSISRSQSPTSPTFQPFVTRSPSRNGKARGSESLSAPLSRDDGSISPTNTTRTEDVLKASALLRSVMDNLPSSEVSLSSFGPSPSTASDEPPKAQTLDVPSSTNGPQQRIGVPTRSPIPSSFNDPEQRKRALTEALFGQTSNSPNTPSPPPGASQHPYSNNDLTLEDLTIVEEPASQAAPVTFGEEVLANVARRNMEATDALKSPGLIRGESMLKRHGTKRINAKLISAPQPVGSSMSVDATAVPLASMSQSSLKDLTSGEKQSSKLSLRIKKLREKLKSSKSGPNGDEVTPWSYDARSPTPSSSAQAATPMTPSTTNDTALSAPPGDIRTFRFPSPVPAPSPNKETSGLKNMLHRLRSNSRREPSGSDHSNTGSGPSTSVLDISLGSAHDGADAQETPRSYRSSLPPVHTRMDVPPQVIDLTSPREDGQDLHFDLSTPPPANPNMDDAAINQLFAAADNLGLDKAALTALLARSTSTSSKSTAWTPITRSNSLASPATTVVHGSGGRDSTSTSKYLTTDGLKRAASTRATNALSRVPEQPALTPPTLTPPTSTLRPPMANGNGSNTNSQVIVRRTLIFPSEGDVGLQRKASTAKQIKKRRASTQSVTSARSVQDRAPTPPPNRSSRRLSKDQSHPMPSLSPALAEKARMSLRHSTMGFGHRAKGSVSSNYGSLFDMYGGESDAPDQSVPPSPGLPVTEPGQALEVVELSNGEVIWNVVDAMRSDFGIDEDASSLAASHLSSTSEYSRRDSEDAPRSKDNLQIFFKEHRRKDSKGSISSTTSRHKVLAANANRPETKVFFSSAAHIGRLIEAMSKSADAGTFNFAPGPIPDSPRPSDTPSWQSHSPAISMTLTDNLTMEDRLEHLLKMTSSAV